MSKIVELDKMRSTISIGKFKCSDIWALDGQSKLKGNSLKAFERSFSSICEFEKIKESRTTYYIIREIYSVVKQIEHKNKKALLGNRNRKDKICFEKNSNIEYVAAIILNKVEYFSIYEDSSFKTLFKWGQVVGLTSDIEKVNNKLRCMIERAIIKLEMLGFISINIKYMACINGNHYSISKGVFDNYKAKSSECFKKAMGEEINRRYKSYYQFRTLYKWTDKFELDKRYWSLMNTDVEYVYRTYKLERTYKEEDLYNEKYWRLLDVLFDDSYNQYNITVQENIRLFVEQLEKEYI